MPDKIKITILPDGTIKTETDKISMPNHAGAESFLRQIARLLGGVTKITRRSHAHTHTHDHEHEHGGEHHHH